MQLHSHRLPLFTPPGVQAGRRFNRTRRMRQWHARAPGIRSLLVVGCGALLIASLLGPKVQPATSPVGSGSASAPVVADVTVSGSGRFDPIALAREAIADPGVAASAAPSPGPGSPPAAAADLAYVMHTPHIMTHIVRPDETLESIASHYGTTGESIVSANPDVDLASLHPGTPLLVLTSPGVLHTVAPGEYVEEIAYQYMIDASTVFAANPIAASGYLMPDERLIIPGARPISRSQVASRGASRSRQAPTWAWPVFGPLTSRFGPRWGAFHGGIDIAAETGTPIGAAAAGSVAYVGEDWLYGLHVVIDHGQGMRTLYAHASELRVSAGRWVEQGQTVALVGSTGYSTGPHLHFEIIVNGETVDPIERLP